MAIDVRTSRKGRFDRNKYYKATYVTGNKLTSGAIAQGIFYSTDTVAVNVVIFMNGNVQAKQYTVTIETSDYVGDLEPNDYVLYSGELWLVVNAIPDDQNKSKEFNSRPVYTTTISLRK